MICHISLWNWVKNTAHLKSPALYYNLPQSRWPWEPSLRGSLLRASIPLLANQMNVEEQGLTYNAMFPSNPVLQGYVYTNIMEFY